MEILSANYLKTNQSIQVSLEGDATMSIPVNEGNRHYKILMKWVEKGGVIEDYVAPKEQTFEEDFDELIDKRCNKILKGFINALNNGSFIPRENYKDEFIKNIIKNNI